MNTENIDQLIKKYFDGNTSLADEQRLKAYFASQGVAEQHRQYVSLFRLLNAETNKQAPATLDSRLEKMFAEQPAKPFYRQRQILWYFSGIAAAVVLLLGIFLTMQRPGNPPPELTAEQRREVLLAYNQTKATLAFVGQNLSKGTQPLEKINKLETAQEAIQQLGKIDRKINQVSSSMQTFSSQIDNLQQLSKFNIINN
jgi:hypothetical protein